MAKSDTMIGSQMLPPLSRAVFALAHMVLIWEVRRTSRRDLHKLDDHLLRDIGLPRATAQAEADKPFWIA
jgi:uncharacterized protein YjiS (DUF1127 family)